jgi:RNA polymerase sigma-70 factor (ECF subfamily)
MNQTGSPSEPERALGAATAPIGSRSASWIEEHADAVYRYVRRRLGPEDAEDVTQQAFEALFRAEQDGRQPDNAGAYLLGTARRRTADVLRRRARRGPVCSLPEGWEGLATRGLPAPTLAAAELHELVHVALGFLSGVDRAALLAYYREDVPVAEIGRRMGTSEKSAEMRLRRARHAYLDHFLSIGGDWVGGSSTSEDAGERGVRP